MILLLFHWIIKWMFHLQWFRNTLSMFDYNLHNLQLLFHWIFPFPCSIVNNMIWSLQIELPEPKKPTVMEKMKRQQKARRKSYTSEVVDIATEMVAQAAYHQKQRRSFQLKENASHSESEREESMSPEPVSWKFYGIVGCMIWLWVLVTGRWWTCGGADNHKSYKSSQEGVAEASCTEHLLQAWTTLETQTGGWVVWYRLR